MSRARISVAALTLSAIGFVGILAHEGYRDTAYVPTEGDRPTIGFGSTAREDGSPVQMGDRIDPTRAVARSQAHIAQDEVGLKRCVRGPLFQAEYDLLVDFAYQYGVSTTCNSSMVRQINLGNYEAACAAYRLYKFSGGYDCSTLVSGQPNRRCWGVWTRNLERSQRCVAAQ